MIDKNGKLFGKINIIDLLIILVIIAAAVFFCNQGLHPGSGSREDRYEHRQSSVFLL